MGGIDSIPRRNRVNPSDERNFSSEEISYHIIRSSDKSVKFSTEEIKKLHKRKTQN